MHNKKRLVSSLTPFLVLSSLALIDRNVGAQKDLLAIRTALVTVENESGEPVSGLTSQDFVVEERGVSRDVTGVAAEDKGREVVILVDTSVAFQGEVHTLRQAVQAFIQSVRIDDQVTLYEYGLRPRKLAGPAGDRLTFESAVGKMYAWPSEGAYLLDAIASTAREISSSERSEEAAPAMVVMVAGTGPDLSHTHYRQAIDAGKKSGAVYHAVVYEAPGAAGVLGRREIEETLYELTDKSGGTLKRVLAVTALAPQLEKLGEEIFRPRYRVSFLTEASQKTDPETLSISVQREGAKARLLRFLPGEKTVEASAPLRP